MKTRSDIASGLFICTLFLDQQELSKKVLPSVMNFLHGICYLGVKKSLIETLKPLPPFKKMDSVLVFEKEFKMSKKADLQLKAQDFLEQEICDFRRGFTMLCYNAQFLEKKETYLSELPQTLKKFEKFIGENKWSTGESFTWVDLFFYDVLF